MAWSVDKKCAFPACPNLVSGPDVRYCPAHDKQLKKSWDESREDARARGYTTRWEHVRGMKLRNDPLCEDCHEQGRVKQADMVHHLDGNPKNNLGANLRSLCWPCHGKQKLAHAKGRSKEG